MSTNLVPKTLEKTKKLDNLIKFIFTGMIKEENNPNEEFLNTIDKARQEMCDAQNFFDNVVEPELVDHAIYRIEAAKTKYVFLLKKARDSGIRMNI